MKYWNLQDADTPQAFHLPGGRGKEIRKKKVKKK